MPYNNNIIKILLAASRFNALEKRQHIFLIAAKSIREIENISL
jgi:hypothetical protein